MASDEDLKLSDTLRYYMRDSAAAKNLLYRRLRALANYEAATKNLEKARSKNKDVQAVSVRCCTAVDMCQKQGSRLRSPYFCGTPTTGLENLGL